MRLIFLSIPTRLGSTLSTATAGCKTISDASPQSRTENSETLLEVRNLTTQFQTQMGKINACDQINFSIEKGRTLCLVGESGCGKSVTSLSIMGLLPEENAKVVSGKILFEGQNILELNRETYRKIRGRKIAMIFQEPMTALNPVHTVGDQVSEVFEIHFGMKKAESRQKVIELFEKVKIPDPESRLDQYPHELSGGMKQRVMIAMALACRPSLLIADEPTTALDVTVQAQILHLMKELQEQENTSILFITHDLGVVAQIADQVAVMYAGKIVEHATVDELFESPHHPYTRALLRSIPTLESRRDKSLPVISGAVPPLYALPKGCRFQNRCEFVKSTCEEAPPRREDGKHPYLCHFSQEELSK